MFLDVEEYLNKVKSDQEIAKLSNNKTINNQTSGSTTENSTNLHEKDDSEFDRSYDSSYDKKTSSIADKNRLQTSSSKATNFGAKVPKNMKEFMKSQLSKTKQTGENAVMMICKLFLFLI